MRFRPWTQKAKLRIAVAALLVEAARTDNRFTKNERVTIGELLTHRFSLTAEEAERLLNAGEQAEHNASHIYRFTHLLVEQLNDDQRIEIIEMLWKVAYADGSLDADEDALIRKIAGLLYVDDHDRGVARRRVLQHKQNTLPGVDGES